MIPWHEFESVLTPALNARDFMLDAKHETGLRLFNGFIEGYPELVIDCFANTMVIYNHYAAGDEPLIWLPSLAGLLTERYPWATCGILKSRRASALEARHGILLWGQKPARRVKEHHIWYALDLMMNQDSSFYLDTRLLRLWLKNEAHGLDVLNTFAYTGSLGAAAAAGGAKKVVQMDLNRRFLNLAKDTYSLNGLPVQKADFRCGDFFPLTAQMKRKKEEFDLVIVDPPFFSSTGAGRVNLVSESQRVINKVRPLVRDGGRLVVINNALFLSGQDYLAAIDDLCRDGYLIRENILPVDTDFCGFEQTRKNNFPVDPAPFNHPTKIVVLRVHRKQHEIV